MGPIHKRDPPGLLTSHVSLCNIGIVALAQLFAPADRYIKAIEAVQKTIGQYSSVSPGEILRAVESLHVRARLRTFRAVKLLRYGPRGHEKPGVLDAQGRLRDLSAMVPDIGGSALLPESVERLRSIDFRQLPFVEGSPRLGPCVGAVGKVTGVGLNYKDHAAESGMPFPTEPPLFLKPSSAIIGPNDDVEIPLGSEKTDWEVELGVVIGKPGKYLKLEQAVDHIAGYCIVNDISERAWQLERGGQWDKGKGCDTFAPIGPWLVTADEVPDPQTLDLWLEVDGHRFQQGNTRLMIFSVAYLVTYISQFMSLRSGDIISTGTPPGVGLGQKPPKYLRVGQTMRLAIAGLGIQQQRTVAATSANMFD